MFVCVESYIEKSQEERQRMSDDQIKNTKRVLLKLQTRGWIKRASD
jgi:hypothetical protein